MAYPGSQLHRDAMANNPEALPENNGIGWIGYSQHSYECFPLATDKLANWEIVKFRDQAFINYFSEKSYVDKTTAKFGPKFKEQINNMLAATNNKPLKRKIVIENS